MPVLKVRESVFGEKFVFDQNDHEPYIPYDLTPNLYTQRNSQLALARAYKVRHQVCL